MARNRRIHPPTLRPGAAVKAVLLCALLVGAAVGYVMQKNKLLELGRVIKARETQLEKLRIDNARWMGQLSELQLPQRLVEQVQHWNLGLTQPPPHLLVWLPEPRPRPAPGSNRPALISAEEGARRRPRQH